MRREIHETRKKLDKEQSWNVWDKWQKTKDGAEMYSLADTIWPHFQHFHSVIACLRVEDIPIIAQNASNGLGSKALVSPYATISFVDM